MTPATPRTDTSPSQVALDALTMPLTGLRLIEASAGTGKTYTLAALYVRLVLGEPQHVQHGAGLDPPQILVMTYTEAATAELRGRIRQRLAQALACFQSPQSVAGDEFLLQLRNRYAPNDWPQCAQRLALALQWMDDAAIYTIHGWSQRMLRAHAFDSESLFEQRAVEDSRMLQLQAVCDYWRRWYYPLPPEQLGAINKLASTPERLLVQIESRWRQVQRDPNASAALGEFPHSALASWAQWQATLDAMSDQARGIPSHTALGAMQKAAASKVLKRYASYLPGRLDKLSRWLQGEPIEDKALQWFSASTLAKNGWSAAHDHAFFLAIDAVCQHQAQEPEIQSALLEHAQQAVQIAYQDAKSRLAQFDFSDLLTRLYHGVQKSDRLVQAIRKQYPVALVDEFQDTDPWQFGTLWALYGARGDAASGLILIGDPKQAIYGFRGADLGTYLHAREQVQVIHTLRDNYRSSEGLVAAVNHLFENASQPFGDLSFEAAVAKSKTEPIRATNGVAQVALTVWHQDFAPKLNKGPRLRHLAAVCASEIVNLLNQAQPTGAVNRIQPSDVAILVRSGTEAALIRAALSQRGLRSVYLSERSSVYASPEASDLWRLMRALVNPGALAYLRAALSTRLWGLDWNELQQLFSDERAWDQQVERFQMWREVWQKQGFLPMLHRLIHEHGIARRCLHSSSAKGQSGQRTLTNLLHLGELLQAASLNLQGPGALVRHLQSQIENPDSQNEANQLRLEGDEQLVQVVTMHKSKGLQYPLVFLPFVSAPSKVDAQERQLRLEEEMRLLYVALTRAQQAMWIAVAPFTSDVDATTGQGKTALSRLLKRQTSDDLAQCLQDWATCEHIHVQPAPEPSAQRYRGFDRDGLHKPARQARRVLQGPWWRSSFSALVQGMDSDALSALTSERESRLADAQIDNQPSPVLLLGAQALPASPVLGPYQEFPAGSRYGTLLHDLLEWQCLHGWPLATSAGQEALAREWDALLVRKTQGLGLSPAQLDLLGNWLVRCLKQAMSWRQEQRSISLCLADLPSAASWPEMGFSLSVAASQVSALDRLVAEQILPGRARTPLSGRRLQGMMVGFMDLVFEHHGRYHVLDYKSNKLPAYAPGDLATAMLEHRYDVQMSLYALALHRLLRSRQLNYDFDQHFGGAVYWFLRGVDDAGAGVYFHRPTRAWMEALDRLFSGSPQALAGAVS